MNKQMTFKSPKEFEAEELKNLKFLITETGEENTYFDYLGENGEILKGYCKDYPRSEDIQKKNLENVLSKEDQNTLIKVLESFNSLTIDEKSGVAAENDLDLFDLIELEEKLTGTDIYQGGPAEEEKKICSKCKDPEQKAEHHKKYDGFIVNSVLCDECLGELLIDLHTRGVL